MASDTKPADDKPVEQKPEQKPAALGEDDEFEDFPVDGANLPTSILTYRAPKLTETDWPEDQTEAAQGSHETKHLWEESWDDDDTTDDFSAQLK